MINAYSKFGLEELLPYAAYSSLVNALVKTESGGDPDAVSPVGAVGEMQTMPSTLRDPGYGVTPAKDDSPEERTRVGQEYIAAMIKKYNGNLNLAFPAYNAGPGRVDEYGGIPPFEETRGHLAKVKKYVLQDPDAPPALRMWAESPMPTGEQAQQPVEQPVRLAAYDPENQLSSILDDAQEQFQNVSASATSKTLQDLTPGARVLNDVEMSRRLSQQNIPWDTLSPEERALVSVQYGNPAAMPQADILWNRQGERIDPSRITQDQREAAQWTQGIEDIRQGLALRGREAGALFGLLDPENPEQYQQQGAEERAAYEKLYAPEGIDWRRIGGNALALGTMGAALRTMPGIGPMLGPYSGSLPMQMAKSAGIGIPAGAAFFNQNPQELLLNMAGGGIGGALGPVLGMGLSSLGGWAGRKLKGAGQKVVGAVTGGVDNIIEKRIRPIMDEMGIDFGELDDNFQNILKAKTQEALDAGDPINPRDIYRRSVIESLGFKGQTGPTYSQVTRDPMAWTEERNLSQAQGAIPPEGQQRLADRYSAQNERMKDVTAGIVEAQPGVGATPIQAAERAFDSVIDQWRSLQKDVGAAYKAAAGSGRTAKLDSFTNQLEELMAENYAEVAPALKVADASARRMKIFDDEGVNDVTVDSVELLRRKLGDLAAKTNNRTEEWALRKLVDSIDDDIANTAGGDAFKEARALARARFKTFEPKVLDQIIKQSANETNFITSKIMGGKPGELRSLKNLLNSSQDGAVSWDGIRKAVWDEVIKKAFQGEVTGSSTFHPRAFKKVINETIGIDRMRILFPNELGLINRLKEAGEFMFEIPPYSAQNFSGTGQYIQRMTQDLLKAARMGNKGMAEKVVTAVPGAVANARQNAATRAILSGTAPASARTQETARGIADLVGRIPLLGPSIQATPWNLMAAGVTPEALRQGFSLLDEELQGRFPRLTQ